MMMDDYRNSDNFQRTEGCKMTSPHYSHLTNGVGPSDVNHFCLVKWVSNFRVISRLGIVFILSSVSYLSLGDELNAPKLVERSYYISSETNSRLFEAAEAAGVEDSDLNKSIVPLSELFGVDWPEGSIVGNSSNINYICVRNTSENIEKFERFLSKAGVQPKNVEVDVKFVEAGRSALSAVGYFDGARTNAAIMLEKLLSRGDVKLLHATRGVAKFSEESLFKSVTEYYYPRLYDVEFIGKSLQCTNQGSSVSAVASPNDFIQEEFGAIVDVSVDDSADKNMLYVQLGAYLQNIAKITDVMEAFLNEVTRRVEMDVCCIEADEKVLKDVDYYSSNRVDSAILQKRLISHSDAKLIADSHLIMDQGYEQLVKSTMVYRYPDYDMIFDNISSNQTDNAGNQSVTAFEITEIDEKESGVIIEPLVAKSSSGEDLCDVELRVNIHIRGEI